MKKKVLATLVAFLAVVTQAAAGPVTREQAKEFAVYFLQEKGVALQGELSVIDGPVRAADMRNSNVAPSYYVFNNGQNGGFVIVSGDNRTQMVLGYSEKGHFSNDEQSPAYVMMKQYVGEMELLDKMNITEPLYETASGRMRLQTPTHDAVQPLITCQWNQVAPYNASCPKYSSKATLAGCVPVAMAQLAYYYRSRMNSTLQYSVPAYTTSTLKLSVPAIKSGTKIDWANMFDHYDGTQNATQKTAVANFIYYCGVMLRADFHTTATAASTTDIPVKLATYFGFNTPTKLQREDFTYKQWKELIINNLYQGRPVLYRAVDNASTLGHAFVIDGFDGGDLFHVNWGWGGQSDGFYSLSVLNPYDVEGENALIKPTNYEQNYIKDQTAYFNLQPLNGYNDVDPRTALTCLVNTVSGTTVTATYTNKTGNKATFRVGLGYLDSKEQLQLLKDYGSTATLASNSSTGALKYTLSTTDFSAKKLTKGTYTLIPVSKKDDGEWEVCEQSSTPKFIKAVYSSSLTLTLGVSGSEISVTNITFPGDNCKGNAKQPVDITIKNNGQDFFGSLYLFASTSSTKGSYKSTAKPYIPAGKTVKLRLYFSSSSASTYNIWVATDASGSNVVGSSKVTISSNTYERKLAASNFALKNEKSAKYVLGTTLEGTVTITNKSAKCRYADYIRFYLMRKESSWKSTSNRIYTYVELAPGESKVVKFKFEDLNPADKYAIAVFYDDVTKLYDGYLYSNISLSHAAMCYDQNGEMTAIEPAATITVPTSAVAVDFTGTTGTVKKVVPNSNPNTIYLVGTNESIISGLSGKNFVKGNSSDAITLSNKYSFYSPRWFTAKKVTFNLVPTLGTTGKAGWQTVVMPFDAEKVTCEGYELEWFKSDNDYGKNFWLKEFSAIEGANTVCFGYVSEIRANHPYLYAVPGNKWGEANNLVGKTMSFTGSNAIIYSDPITVSASDAFNFRGSYATASVPMAYTLDATGAKFSYSKTATVKPFTCYFVKTEDDITDVNDLNIGTFIPETDGIDMMDAPVAGTVEVYSVNGMKVGTAEVRGSSVSLEGLPKGIYIIQGKKFVVR